MFNISYFVYGEKETVTTLIATKSGQKEFNGIIVRKHVRRLLSVKINDLWIFLNGINLMI